VRDGHVAEVVGRELAPDELGNVTVAHVPPGHLQLEVRSVEHPWRNLGEREARAGERLDLGTIELALGGHVAGSLSGGGRAQLELSLADEKGLLAGTIEAHGDRYRSNALAPGHYTFYVRGPGVGDQRHEVEIAAGRDARLDLVLEALPTFRLTLLTGEKARAAKALSCAVVDADGKSLCMRSQAVAGAASLYFELPLPSGAHKLYVISEQGRLLETEISASAASTSAPLTLNLP